MFLPYSICFVIINPNFVVSRENKIMYYAAISLFIILCLIVMSMFDQMGQMKQLYDKYKKLQDALKNLIIRSREDGILIDMS